VRKRSNSTLLYYDDWNWDSAGSSAAGIGRAVKFTPPAYPKILRSVRFYMLSTSWSTITGTCNIWDDDGSGGMPGTLLYTQAINTKLAYMGLYYEQWITIELPEISPISISSGSFYVEFRWAGTTVYLGYDFSNPGIGIEVGNDYYYNGASWSLDSADNKRDYYIEAVVSDADATNADRVNNVEGIDQSSPQAGLWQARIRGYNIPQGPQPYAIVVSGDVKGIATVDAHASPQPNRDLPEWNDSEPEKMSVLKFKITDHAEDNLPTLIDRLIVDISGTGGNAGNDIAWAELYDNSGAARVALASSITNSLITFGSAPNSDNAAQLDSIAENSSIQYTVYIYLKAPLLAAHGSTYIFDIDETNIGVDAGNSSQMFGDTSSVTPVTGTIFIEALGITVTPNNWALGPVILSSVAESGSFSLQNSGNVAENFQIKGADGTGGWVLSNTIGQDAFRVDVDQDDNGSYDIVLTKINQLLFSNISVGGTKAIGLKYSAPSSDTKGKGVAQDFLITITASRYVP
jgi:hypothetical protein